MVRERPGGTVVEVPRAALSLLAGERHGALLVRLAAAPVDGQANAVLVEFLAGTLGLPPCALTVGHGKRARLKQVLVAGLRAADVLDRLRPRP